MLPRPPREGAFVASCHEFTPGDETGTRPVLGEDPSQRTLLTTEAWKAAAHLGDHVPEKRKGGLHMD